ncbi:MAG: hypothetical protein IKP49_08205 [Treponema sp.]|nr:hypothetical protein [Treponema sp.]
MPEVAFKQLSNQVAVLPYEQQMELLYVIVNAMHNRKDEPNETTLAAAAEVKDMINSHAAGTKDIDAFFEDLDD